MTQIDKTLSCRDCGSDFVFTTGEQQFYQSKGLLNEPSRCPACRAARKADGGRSGGGYAGGKRELYPVVCADCGCDTQVPFQPKDDRPVYCSACFDKHRSER